jgi:hypothetical protein
MFVGAQKLLRAGNRRQHDQEAGGDFVRVERTLCPLLLTLLWTLTGKDTASSRAEKHRQMISASAAEEKFNERMAVTWNRGASSAA